MWVEKVNLKNIKCFESLEIVFSQNNQTGYRAKPYNWVTLLGENGVGKSTILQTLGLLLAGPEAAKELLPRPTGWVRDPNELGKIGIGIHKEDNDFGSFGTEKIAKTFSYSYTVTGDQPIVVGSQTYTEPALIEEP